METNQQLIVKMKIVVNTIAIIALFIQFAYSAFNMLSMQKPITSNDMLYNYFLLVALPCSDIIVIVFLLLYNFDYIFLKNRIINVLFLIIGILAMYIHVYQLFILNDLILSSIVLLLIDSFVFYRIIKKIMNSKI